MNDVCTSSRPRSSGPARWELPQHSQIGVTLLTTCAGGKPGFSSKPFHPKVCLNAHPHYTIFQALMAHREWAKAAKAGDFLPGLKHLGSRP